MLRWEWDQGLRKCPFPSVVHIRADKEILEFGGKAWEGMREFNQLEGAFQLIFPRVCYVLCLPNVLDVPKAETKPL